MNFLTSRTEMIAALYFPSESGWVKDQLQFFCEHLSEYISDKATLESYERFCFAVLKVGKRSKSKFLQAIELGKCDYRDLLVAAGFENSTTIHNEWAEKMLSKKT